MAIRNPLGCRLTFWFFFFISLKKKTANNFSWLANLFRWLVVYSNFVGPWKKHIFFYFFYSSRKKNAIFFCWLANFYFWQKQKKTKNCTKKKTAMKSRDSQLWQKPQRVYNDPRSRVHSPYTIHISTIISRCRVYSVDNSFRHHSWINNDPRWSLYSAYTIRVSTMISRSRVYIEFPSPSVNQQRSTF